MFKSIFSWYSFQENLVIEKDETIKSQDFSTSEESDSSRKIYHKKAKREQKNKIVRNIFLNVSKSDNGAKGKGQVMIVDHSEDSQKQVIMPPRNSQENTLCINSQHGLSVSPTQLICKIELSRLIRIPNEKNQQLFNNNFNEKGAAETDITLMVIRFFTS